MSEEVKKQKPRRNKYRYGDDFCIIRERRRENRKEEIPICDRHIDGA